jgi:tripartite-type tricarboxylate transporter receptor subunit TctC
MLRKIAVLSLVLAVASLGMAQAETYPDRTIKIVVPTGPAGSYDLVGRLIADQLSKRLNQTVIVENRTGAGTVVGTQSAIAATPDGYTLLIGGLSNIVFNGSLYSKPKYDPLKDLVPIAIFFKFSYILVGSPSLPYKSVKDIIEAARQKPDSLNLAHAGLGTGQHLTGVAFMKYSGTKMTEVPYRGSSAVFPDLLSGRVDLFFDSAAAVLPYIKAGKLRGYASLTSSRPRSAPDVPTMKEEGVSNLEVESWLGLFAPAGTPQAVIDRLRVEILASVAGLEEPFDKIGGEPFQVPAKDLPAFLRAEYDKWTAIIKEAHISLD